MTGLIKYRVTGGLGRLCQFPKTVEVMAKSEVDAHCRAMNLIRDLITQEDFDGDSTSPMLTKVINSNNIVKL